MSGIVAALVGALYSGAGSPPAGLFDDFPGSSIDTGKWAATTVLQGYVASVGPTQGGTVVVGSGVATLTPTASLDRAVGLSSFNTSNDLRNKAVIWDVASASAVRSDLIFSVALSSFLSGQFADFMIATSPGGGGGVTLYALYNNAGSSGTTASIAYNAATMRFLRVRHVTGDWYWEYAASLSGPWTVLRQRSVDAGTAGNQWDPDVASHAIFCHNSSAQTGVVSSVDAVYIE